MPSVMEMIRFRAKLLAMEPTQRTAFLESSCAYLTTIRSSVKESDALDSFIAHLKNTTVFDDTWFKDLSKTYGSHLFFNMFVWRLK
jgi:hypothetical protein